MKVGILINRVTWEVKRLINELKKRNIEYDLLNNQKIYFRLSTEKDLQEEYDLFLERSLSYLRGLYSAAILETKGYKIINNFKCLNITGNKLFTTLKLIEHDIPTPQTCVAFKEDSAIQAIEEEINYPAIIKPLIGSWGRLIAKLDNYNNAVGNLECRELMGNVLQKIYYIQDYLKPQDSNTPTDLRVFIIGNECVAAMGRFNPEDDFRSNIAIGGTAEKIEISKEIEELSLKSSQSVNGEIIGVDLMMKEDKWNVIEINGTPQFRAISSSTKINIARKIVDYLIKNYK
jgi:[lysine-biosynthesis-protein LysW]--L-2-aminoadipate ligase